MRLGVNVDHIATLRQARLEAFPDPVEAAKECIAGGADGIVCHLREDRRHINDRDLKRLRQLPTRLDMEMAATDEMLKIALKIKPDMVTLVPEKRREVTTEGGLHLTSKLKKTIDKLQDKGIDVSLFIDPDLKQVEEAAVLGARFIEIHTGRYSRRLGDREIRKIGTAVQKARLIGLRINAGHGIDYNNIGPILKIPGIEELNIGFSIIVRAVFVGIRQAVEEMREAIR
ncbi:pyridoxine 5'-phosphate synthase [candidate division WOR-1 bacterium RIFOXYA2_FULL_46_56]|uniref:Pyridoxine 5'-phosphate synthase n=1 Tax=candidate division WOR-1 bacterium RIFOXYC2_FULL_46_14 TaxID=1802587 RepID=A0A1F4U5K0_UNCSA|nr:MAG: pyridoxine 5'-phosphate synthase [candidate division WOR-1 bacterium RIFOXYB2_FULL_46_45]OGC31875.1 MAG: pyridoxine 5'-phosphate synthase [candidate division WOR-1 bacterium RIFOXYA2_FULL_46_56]OGC40234.1 MAG: pyridoxine 5'-phosphate synthase [candidate division WOR-1 bacterium RIFOXYC2_FULL_46_14]